MTTELEIGLYIFMLAAFLGYHLISRVPPLLHTPLMSATNAMSGISLIGSMVIAGAGYSPASTMFGFIAVACSSTNVVGGFLITDRMLRMFRSEHDVAQRSGVAAMLRKQWHIVVLGAGCFGLLLWLAAKLLSDSRPDLTDWLKLFYIISAALFILGLKGLGSPRHARRGMFCAEAGMLLAVVGTLFHHEIVTYRWIAGGIGLGTVIGGSMGFWIPMTAVPQRTALSHSLGALAATLIGVSEYLRLNQNLGRLLSTTIGLEVVIGGLTFTGSLMAAGKLQGALPAAPITYKGQNIFNTALLGAVIGFLVYLVFAPSAVTVFFTMLGLALLFGFLLVIPIGAADMPVVISLLNSYAGLADAAMGFVLMNKIQIITGSLDGTSGFLLSLLMCRAMNRSITNVLFGAFGKTTAAGIGTAATMKASRSITVDEVPSLLESSRSVIIVPGYGMAVAQAQHAVAELGNVLVKKGVNVKYAIHPVAGRMPGHMNVLLAEANIPYDRLFEMERINPYFPEADLVLVIGANDVTNPAAKHDRASPLYGMPILEVDRARAIIVLKRSMRPGFAGVENELYYDSKCMMLFGDAKESITQLLALFK